MFPYHPNHLPLLVFLEERDGNISSTGSMENGLLSPNSPTVMDFTQLKASHLHPQLHAQDSLKNSILAISQVSSCMSWLRPNQLESICTTELSSISEFLFMKVLFQLHSEFKALKSYTHTSPFFSLSQKAIMDTEKIQTLTMELMPHYCITKKLNHPTFQFSPKRRKRMKKMKNKINHAHSLQENPTPTAYLFFEVIYLLGNHLLNTIAHII